MKKPKYIRKKEKEETNKCFSLSEIYNINKDIIEYFDGKKVNRVWEKSYYNDDFKIVWDEIIYKTNQDFYIHLKRMIMIEDYNMTIYYNNEQLNELKIFINQAIKQYIKWNN